MRHLVTGGAGFIGSHIVDRLLLEGQSVVVIDNESSDAHDSFYWNSKAENHKLDICRYDDIANLFTGIDTVFHCAAEARIQKSTDNPLQSVLTNSYGTACVLHACRMNSVRRLVYSSTSSSYGNNLKPNVEYQIEDCLTPYSISKVAGEKLCKFYHDNYGLETVSLRYFNVYGERHPIKGSYATVVGKFIKKKKEGQPLTIVGDGSQKRDFTNISDVVEANILASIKSFNYGEIFNIGTGTNITIKKLASLISEKTVNLPARIGEVQETLADINKAKNVLGWSPSVALEDWIQQNA